MVGLVERIEREIAPIEVAVFNTSAIDTEFIRSNFPERYAANEQQGILSPDSIAEAYWQIHMQPRDAWTHATELRPWMENW